MTRLVPGPCSASPCLILPCPVSAPVFSFKDSGDLRCPKALLSNALLSSALPCLYFKDSGDSRCPRALLSNALLSSALPCERTHSNLGPSLSAICSAAIVKVMCFHKVLCMSCSLLRLLSTDLHYICTWSSCLDSTPAVCAVATQQLDPKVDVAEANQYNEQNSIPATPLVVLPNTSCSSAK